MTAPIATSMFRRGVTRRGVLRLGVLGGLAAVVPLAGCGGGDPEQTGEQLTSAAPLPEPFTLPWRRPPVLRPVSTEGGTDRYRITARVAQASILPGRPTSILGYEGIYPGPTIESRRGRTTVVEHVNELPVPLVVHLHGGQVPAASDGYPTDLVLPAGGGHAAHTAHPGHQDPDAVITTGRREYVYPIDQPAATLWYHDHRMDFTGPAVYRGLAGFHLVRDDEEDALPLPRGERELPLLIADRAFEEDGSFRYPSRDPSMTGAPGVEQEAIEGVLGDVVLVNGVPWPVAEVDTAWHRLRLLNASNARRYRLVLDPPPADGDPFVQIGSDVGLLDRPQGLRSVTMAPGERFDVLVDFGGYDVGTRVTVRNELGDGRTADVMQFVVARAAAERGTVPAVLRPIERIDRADAVGLRRFRFRRGAVGDMQGWVINDAVFSPTRPIAEVRGGDVEIWRVSTDLHHPVHVHLGHFQVLSRGGGLLPEDAGWKDTIDLRPGETAEIAVRFPDLPGRYVLHCHNLEHEDMAMMATFRVV